MPANHPFKSGDKIKCVDDQGGHTVYLVHGHEYTVKDIGFLAGEPQVVLDVPQKHKTWYAKRFVLASP
jgi:hypothetical protein